MCADHDLVIAPVPYDDPVARRLVAGAVDELRRRYGRSDEDMGRPVPQAADFAVPGAFFLVAWRGPDAVGCVGLLARGHGEVRRLFVWDEHRGQGVARALMAALEERAAAAGHDLLRLETGEAQPEAIALYRATGWRPIDPWPGAPAHLGSVYFEKELPPGPVNAGA